MPNVFLRSKPTRIEPEALRATLAEALAAALGPDTPSVEVGTGQEVVLSWLDGPAASTVADLVAGVVNWEVRTVAAPAAKAGAPAVLLARRFSPQALAVAVVRYHASNVRPYDSRQAVAVERLGALLEVDDPTVSGYPVPDAMAALLLAAPDPGMIEPGAAAPDDTAGAGEPGALTRPDASPADRLAAKLVALGYDRLWHDAWSGLA